MSRKFNESRDLAFTRRWRTQGISNIVDNFFSYHPIRTRSHFRCRTLRSRSNDLQLSAAKQFTCMMTRIVEMNQRVFSSIDQETFYRRPQTGARNDTRTNATAQNIDRSNTQGQRSLTVPPSQGSAGSAQNTPSIAPGRRLKLRVQSPKNTVPIEVSSHPYPLLTKCEQISLAIARRFSVTSSLTVDKIPSTAMGCAAEGGCRGANHPSVAIAATN